jgi:hypothetical protein
MGYDEIFSGYQMRQVSVFNLCFEDHPETSVQFGHLTRLIAREDFIEFSR